MSKKSSKLVPIISGLLPFFLFIGRSLHRCYMGTLDGITHKYFLVELFVHLRKDALKCSEAPTKSPWLQDEVDLRYGKTTRFALS
jgi:hypothetical protein